MSATMSAAADPSTITAVPGGSPPLVASKRSLLSVSRSIEAMARRVGTVDHNTIVVSMFQEGAYLEQSLEHYWKLARHCNVVVAGAHATEALPRQGNLIVTDLPEVHPLAQEWTVLALSSLGCSGLVAMDLHRAGPGRSSESARLFEARVGTLPRWVAGQLNRIVDSAGPALSNSVAARLREAAGRASAVEDDAHAATLAPELEDGWRRLVVQVEQLQQTERLAMRDPLTGAFNRRMLDGYLAVGGPRVGHDGAMSVVAFDFDGFKHINDTYGHAVGDDVLKAFVEAVRACTRDGDVVVRLGGDEFVLLLPTADLAQAQRVVHRVLDRFAQTQVPGAPGLRPRASAGVGIFPVAEVDLDAVDAALYRAKNSAERVVAVETA